MKQQTQHRLAFSMFVLVTISLIAGGIVGISFGIIELRRVRRVVTLETRLDGRIVRVTRRNRGSENRIQVLLLETDELVDVSIAKLFTLEMEPGDEVQVLRDNSGEKHYLYDDIRGHKGTIWLRILVFTLCLGLSIPFAYGAASILQALKGGKS
jgi:hypothetical protein